MSEPEPTLFWTPELVQRFPSASGPAEAIRLVGDLLVKAGAATEAYVRAAIERERGHPTGLPARIPFALVHTDAPGARRLAASLGIFESAVFFGRMDRPEEKLPVQLVVMLAVPERHMQAELLGRLISALTEPGKAEELVTAPQPTAYDLLSRVAA
jgi:PTS system galactitol-specific IIA component